jgi:hypothetical protein
MATDALESMGQKLVVADGKDIANLEKCLKGKGFKGTVISE